MIRPTAFGRALAAERVRLGMTRARFAELCRVSDKHLQRYEYGRRGVAQRRATHDKAAEIARNIGLPPWHFEQALAEDRLAHVCRAAEVTAVIVGLASYIESKLPGEQWAAVRAMLLGGL